MVFLWERTQINRYQRGRLTGNLREGDPELETLSSLELAGAYIRGSLDESNSRRLPIFTGGKGSEVSGLVISGLDRGADNGRVSAGGDVLVSGCDGWRKKMQPNTQSIIGLKRVSQWYPSTIVQPWSNGVTKNVRF